MKLILPLFLLSFQLSVFSQYHVYTDLTNLFSQKVIETKDKGLLLVASEDCYTPGAVTIEGCMYALHLVRTNAMGDTMWTRRFGFSGSVIGIFENVDGGFSFFCRVNDSWQCDNIGIGLFGFSAVRIINLSSTGLVQNTVQFPETCELVLKDVVVVNDSLFAALAIFSKPIYWPDESEGRLMILNKQGEILHEINSPGENWNRGRFLQTGTDKVEMLYVDTSNIPHIAQYDLMLNEVTHTTNVEIENQCFDNKSNRLNRFRAKNGDIIISCQEKTGSDYFFHLLRFDDNLALLSNTTNNFNALTNLVELPDEHFVIATSGVNDSITHSNTNLVYMAPVGTPVHSRTIEYPEFENPTQIQLTSNDSIIVVGNMNCCNMDTSIGPGKSFLLFGEYFSTSTNDQLKNSPFSVFPNPANQNLHIAFNREATVLPNKMFLFDPLGRLVLNHALSGITESIDISGIAGGLYFYVLLNNNIPLASGKLVKY